MKNNQYFLSGGILVLIGATSVEDTNFKAGETYDFTATGGTALCKWGPDNATIADGGFDFAVPPGAVVRATCPTGISALNVIEGEAGSTATAVLVAGRVKNV